MSMWSPSVWRTAVSHTSYLWYRWRQSSRYPVENSLFHPWKIKKTLTRNEGGVPSTSSEFMTVTLSWTWGSHNEKTVKLRQKTAEICLVHRLWPYYKCDSHNKDKNNTANSRLQQANNSYEQETSRASSKMKNNRNYCCDCMYNEIYLNLVHNNHKTT